MKPFFCILSLKKGQEYDEQKRANQTSQTKNNSSDNHGRRHAFLCGTGQGDSDITDFKGKSPAGGERNRPCKNTAATGAKKRGGL